MSIYGRNAITILGLGTKGKKEGFNRGIKTNKDVWNWKGLLWVMINSQNNTKKK